MSDILNYKAKAARKHL